MYLYELNGFFYIKDCDIYPNWLTYADKTYFMLNNTTRKKFIQDVLPLIKNGTCGYDQKALDKISKDVWDECLNEYLSAPHKGADE